MLRAGYRSPMSAGAAYQRTELGMLLLLILRKLVKMKFTLQCYWNAMELL